MKRILLLLAAVIFCSAPFACTRPIIVIPSNPPTLSPTPTSTPTCGFINVLGWGFTPAPTDTPTVTPTWNPAFPSPTPTPTNAWSLPTPVATITYPNAPFTGTVIRNLADWSALNGSRPPPAGVDFNTQMILVQNFPGCCYGSAGFANVCVTTTQVEVTLFYAPMTGPAHCGAVCLVTQTIIVPQSSLPVVVTEIITY